jgi:hypothetical protein
MVGIAVATSNLGRQALRVGQLEEAAALLGEARQIFEGMGATNYLHDVEGRHVEMLVLGSPGSDGNADAARALLDHVVGVAGDEFLVPFAHRLVAIASARSGAFDAARLHLDEALERARSISALYDEAVTCAARAVIGTEAGWRTSESWSPRAHARAARVMFAELGVVDCPVTSLEDRWPDGEGARRLVGPERAAIDLAPIGGRQCTAADPDPG